MISVLIPTQNSERLLVPTLASLVAGSAAGIVREVLLVDGGSTDGTEKIADAAGCVFVKGEAREGARLKSASANTRGTWFLFLDPGAVLEEGWQREVMHFMDTTERTGEAMKRAAVFRLAVDGFGSGARLRETLAALNQTLLGTPKAEQGLLISKKLYEQLGGHEDVNDARRRFLWRLGRRRTFTLRTRVVVPA
jgi:glycosyltransferase involved in cell wall biosynthesis